MRPGIVSATGGTLTVKTSLDKNSFVKTGRVKASMVKNGDPKRPTTRDSL